MVGLFVYIGGAIPAGGAVSVRPNELGALFRGLDALNRAGEEAVNGQRAAIEIRESG